LIQEHTAIQALYAIAMSILNIFKRPKPKDKILQVSATLYPDKIIIETIDRAKEGFGISSTKISILPVDTESSLLSLTVRKHLNLTEVNLAIPKDYKQHYADFLKLAGFKNGKEHHKNALLLNLHQKGDTITISPTKNGGYTGNERGFLGIKDSDIIVITDIDDATLGDKIKYGWTKCEYNSI
jgi:CDI immunity protein